VGGVPEVLAGDPLLAQACLVPAGAPSGAYAERVERLLADRELRTRVGARLRELVSARYSPDVHADRLSAILERVAAGPLRTASRRRGA
jgi:glycosyltransferase involved in cell wall biosynthesis